MTHAQVQQLSRLSKVPFTTLWKIKDGTTSNPGIETVRLFIDHIDDAQRAPAAPEPKAA